MHQGGGLRLRLRLLSYRGRGSANPALRGLPSPAESDDAFAILILGRPGQSFPVPGAGFAPVPQIQPLHSLKQPACQSGYARARLLDDEHDGRDAAENAKQE